MKKWIAALVVLGTMSVSGARADISVSVPDFAHLRETVSLSTAGHSGAAVVDWGDGSSVSVAAGRSASHAYARPGNYTVTASAAGAGSVSRNIEVAGKVPLSEFLSRYDDPNYRGVMIMSHRSHTTNASMPENTTLAMDDAIAAGADVIETDFWVTRDGVPVITHDANPLDQNGNRRYISSLDWATVRTIRVRDRNNNVTSTCIQSAEEFLRHGRGRVYFNIDKTDANDVSAMVKVIDKLNMWESVIFYAASKKDELVAAHPGVHLGCWAASASTFTGSTAKHNYTQGSYQPTGTVFTNINAGIRDGLLPCICLLNVHDAATPNFGTDPAAIKAITDHWGRVGYIMTDDPAGCASALNSLGYPTGHMAGASTLYVLPESNGDACGRSWEDAMGPAEFARIMSDDTDLSGIDIVFGEGTFQIPMRTALTKKVKSMRGQGVGKTVIRPASAPSSIDNLFYVRGADILIVGITFDGGYGVDQAARTRAFWLDGTGSTLDFWQCEFRGFNCGAGGDWDGVGSVLNIDGSADNLIKMRDVSVHDNRSSSRGVVRLGGAGRLFVTNSRFYGNVTNNNWGICVHGATASTVCVNNTSFADNRSYGTWRPIMVNTDGDLLLLSSSFYAPSRSESHIESMVRYNEARTHLLANNFFFGEDNVYSVHNEGTTAKFTSGGANIFQHFLGTTEDNAGDTFLGDVRPSNLTVTDGGAVRCDVPDVASHFLTADDLHRLATNFNSVNVAGVGADFIGWVNTDLYSDCEGNRRNSAKFQPGSYDAYLSTTSDTVTDIRHDAAADTEPEAYYTLSGQRLSAAPGVPGVYLVRRGATVKKVLIR